MVLQFRVTVCHQKQFVLTLVSSTLLYGISKVCSRRRTFKSSVTLISEDGAVPTDCTWSKLSRIKHEIFSAVLLFSVCLAVLIWLVSMTMNRSCLDEFRSKGCNLTNPRGPSLPITLSAKPLCCQYSLYHIWSSDMPDSRAIQHSMNETFLALHFLYWTLEGWCFYSDNIMSKWTLWDAQGSVCSPSIILHSFRVKWFISSVFSTLSIQHCVLGVRQHVNILIGKTKTQPITV